MLNCEHNIVANSSPFPFLLLPSLQEFFWVDSVNIWCIMLRNSKEKRGESVEMESPEEPPPGGSLINLLIEGKISEDF